MSDYKLTGEYVCKVDAKGRIKLPAVLLRKFSGNDASSFVVNRGYEKCLMLRPQSVWDKEAQRIGQYNMYDPEQRQLIRYFYRGASELNTDTADRILIPKSLIEYAALGKVVVLFAYKDNIEIWSKEAYGNVLDSEPDNFSEMASRVEQSIRVLKNEAGGEKT